MKPIPLNELELKDIDYLLGKIINVEPFYALEISKAKYLLGRIKELKDAKGDKRE